MVTNNHPADPAAAHALTQNDREMLAWYLARGLTPDDLKHDHILTPEVRAWATSPRIAPHIEAFHQINAEAEHIRRTRARIDGYSAVSDALRAAESVAEKLHAVHALIRLNTSCAPGSPRPHEMKGQPTSAPRSTLAPSRPRDPYSNFHLPPLPPLGPRPDQPHPRPSSAPSVAVSAPTNSTGAPTHSHTVPLPFPVGSATARGAEALRGGEGCLPPLIPAATQDPNVRRGECLPLPVGPATGRGAEAPRGGEGRSPSQPAALKISDPEPSNLKFPSPAPSSSPSPSPSIPSSSNSASPAPSPQRPLRLAPNPTIRRLTETSGAAQVGAWP